MQRKGKTTVSKFLKKLLKTEKPSQVENPSSGYVAQIHNLTQPEEAQNPLAVDCYYHAFNPKTGKHFCEEKPIDEYACLRRYQRFQSQGKRCYPKGEVFKRRKKPRNPQDKEEWYAKHGSIFKGHEEGGQW